MARYCVRNRGEPRDLGAVGGVSASGCNLCMDLWPLFLAGRGLGRDPMPQVEKEGGEVMVV